MQKLGEDISNVETRSAIDCSTVSKQPRQHPYLGNTSYSF